MIRFKFTRKETEECDQWLSFYPKRDTGTGFKMVLNTSSYFDPRPQINTNLTSIVAIILPFINLWLLPVFLVLCFYGWGSIYLNLPYDTKIYNQAEYKTYGFMFYHVDGRFPTEIWIRGYKSFQFPWSYKFKKRELLTNDGWKTGSRYQEISDDELKIRYYPYEYKLKNGISQHAAAKVYEEKRYWTRWFGLHTKCRHFLEIEFLSEMGEKAGTWKGGVIGCSWEMKKGESLYQSLVRMEKERKFT